MKISYDDFDALFDEMDEFHESLASEEKVPFYPTEKDLVRIGNDIETFYEYAIYLLATNPPPETDEEKASMDMLNRLIKEKVECVE